MTTEGGSEATALAKARIRLLRTCSSMTVVFVRGSRLQLFPRLVELIAGIRDDLL
jgi:hypothetical protein